MATDPLLDKLTDLKIRKTLEKGRLVAEMHAQLAHNMAQIDTEILATIHEARERGFGIGNISKALGSNRNGVYKILNDASDILPATDSNQATTSHESKEHTS